MRSGLTLGATESLLTQRAADFLAAGPADPQSLISHVCQLPGAPMRVAEMMASALFAGHQRFARESDGRWRLRETVNGPTWPVAQTPDLSRQSFVVVDVETTGSRIYRGDRITEIAAVLVRDGKATTVFETLINPERAIPPSISAITNITWSMVKDAPRFGEICDQLLGALEGHVFVAHNAGFDWRFISMEVERATRRPLEGRTLCTVRMARRLVPQLRRRNLDYLSMHYGVENTARHRAGGDARATAEIFLRLLEAADDRGCESLDDIDRLLSRGTGRRKRRRRPPVMPHSATDDSSA